LLADQYRTAERAQVLTTQVSPSLVEATWQATVKRDGWFEAVADPEVVTAVTADAGMESRCREMLATGNARLYVHDGIPLQVALVDDDALISLTDSDDALRAVIRCTDETVRSWASDVFEQYRDDANPVATDELPTGVSP
jgi:predicted transcriptional regulator